jgi:hypothetical protein
MVVVLSVAENIALEKLLVSGNSSAGIGVGPPGPMSPRVTFIGEPPPSISRLLVRNDRLVAAGKSGGKAEAPVRLTILKALVPGAPGAPGMKTSYDKTPKLRVPQNTN